MNKTLIKKTMQGRLREPITITLDGRGYGGVTAFDNRTLRPVEMIVPSTTTAAGRTVRMHECDHLRVSPRSNNETVIMWGSAAMADMMSMQIMEDVRIHGPALWSARPERVRRDAVAFALRELRITNRKLRDGMKTETLTTEQKNMAIGFIVRAMAVIQGARVERSDRTTAWIDSRFIATPQQKAEHVVMRQIVRLVHRCAVKDRPKSGIKDFGEYARNRRDLQMALRLFRGLLHSDPPAADPETGELDMRGLPFLSGATDGSQDRITVETLPMTVPTYVHDSRDITRVAALSGPRMRSGSLVAMAIGIPGKHFVRRIIRDTGKGASVMIDASGSMHISQEKLEQLSREIPAGFIGYYCGTGDCHDSRGVVTIYAQRNMRAASIPLRMGHGNSADLRAVQIVLAQRGTPKILVTDLKFCGGPDAEIQLAFVLVQRAVARGELIVAPSITDAIKHLDGSAPIVMATDE